MGRQTFRFLRRRNVDSRDDDHPVERRTWKWAVEMSRVATRCESPGTRLSCWMMQLGTLRGQVEGSVNSATRARVEVGVARERRVRVVKVEESGAMGVEDMLGWKRGSRGFWEAGQSTGQDRTAQRREGQ